MENQAGGDGPALSDYAFLSDCTGSALVSSAGSIDWWCVPRFDSPSVFGRLLDPAAGHWSMAPEGDFTTERAYCPDSLVVQTTFDGSSGTVTLTDGLALELGARDHDIGLRSPSTLIRRLDASTGTTRIAVEVAPRIEYGLTAPRWRRTEGRWVATAGPVTLVFEGVGDDSLADHDGTLRGVLQLDAGDRVELRLSYSKTYPVDGPQPTAADLEDTVEGWRSWHAHHSYDGEYADEVRRSAVVLQGLTYAPSGAVIAAATTSLPEHPGGVANWDYRYAWVRDISMTLQALWVAACPDEADRFFSWLAHAAGRLGSSADGVPLQIMFGVEGERDLTEHELAHLQGYRGSRPVRIGNDAWQQRQLDVLGEVLFAAELLQDQLGELDAHLQHFLSALADAAAARWHQPDAGMWESRDGDRHYTSSKVMCWVALDRGVRLADRLGAQDRRENWVRARDELRAAVLDEAWSEAAGAYSGAFGSDELDASVLLLPLVGFLPADDERMLRTVQAVLDNLSDGVLVRRWEAESSGFLLCSWWLVECLARAGRVEEARSRFEALAAYGNDLGLFAEMVDPSTGEQLGNLPQAFSHVGLINAAWAITESARQRARHAEVG